MTDPELLRNLADRIDKGEQLSYAVIALTPDGGMGTYAGDLFRVIGILDYQRSVVVAGIKRKNKGVMRPIEVPHGFKN